MLAEPARSLTGEDTEASRFAEPARLLVEEDALGSLLANDDDEEEAPCLMAAEILLSDDAVEPLPRETTAGLSASVGGIEELLSLRVRLCQKASACGLFRFSCTPGSLGVDEEASAMMGGYDLVTLQYESESSTGAKSLYQRRAHAKRGQRGSGMDRVREEGNHRPKVCRPIPLEA